MKKDVIITISGLQPEVQGDEPIEMTSVGTCINKDGVWYLFYEEEDDGHLTKCRIKASSEGVEMTKEGNIVTRLFFAPGQVNESIYSTPYGDFDMKMMTKSLSFPVTDDLFAVNMIYELGMNGKFVSNCELIIRVEEMGLN